jgi:hypothetical protein
LALGGVAGLAASGLPFGLGDVWAKLVTAKPNPKMIAVAFVLIISI